MNAEMLIQPHLGNSVTLDNEVESTKVDMKNYIRSQVQQRESRHLGTRLLDGEFPELEERLCDSLLQNAAGK